MRTFEGDIDGFVNRRIKARDIFTIRIIDKNVCYEYVRRYHYLGNAKFFCVYGFGLYYKGKDEEVLVGVSAFSNPQGISAMKGWFGLENSDQSVLELSRLCMNPKLNGTNATSFLLGNSIRMLKPFGIRAVITLADSSRHIGSIYQVCNFKYYGLTDRKSDFYSEGGEKNPRSQLKIKVSQFHGVWIERTRKHRYCYLLDKTLKVNYDEQPHPTEKSQMEYACCNGLKRIYDKRYDEWFTCPKCTGYMQKVDKDGTPIGNKVNFKSNEYKEDRQLTLFEF